MFGEDMFDIDYKKININNKDLFLFANHKTALFCWAKLRQKKGICNVITFDSHGDFFHGLLTQGDLTKIKGSDKKNYLGTKYCRTDLPHFSTNKEFTQWNLLNEKENRKIVEIEHKFLKHVSDNFIDVAFMKNIIKDVYWYYLNLNGNMTSAKCDDYLGNIHNFVRKKVEDFKKPEENFILDVDLDFFVIDEGKKELVSREQIKKYLELQKGLFEDKNCIGMTLALEPTFCGSNENCLRLCKYFSEIFKKDIKSVVMELLEKEKK